MSFAENVFGSMNPSWGSIWMFGWDASNSLTSASKTPRSNGWLVGGWPVTVIFTLPPGAAALPSSPQAATPRARPPAASRQNIRRGKDRDQGLLISSLFSGRDGCHVIAVTLKCETGSTQ